MVELGGMGSLGRARNGFVSRVEDRCGWLGGWQHDSRGSAPHGRWNVLSIVWVCLVSIFVSQGGLVGLPARTPPNPQRPQITTPIGSGMEHGRNQPGVGSRAFTSQLNATQARAATARVSPKSFAAIKLPTKLLAAVRARLHGECRKSTIHQS